MKTTSGRLVLVVGSSGAGKDAILRYAKEKLRHNDWFVFPRRVITRPTFAYLEDHESVNERQFDILQGGNAFALSWEAHGLRYGIPREVETDLDAGRVASINVSRTILAEAMRKYPQIEVVEITASVDTRAQRLNARARETVGDMAERAKRVTPPFPTDLPLTVLRNDGPLTDTGEAFCALLLKDRF